MITYTPVQVLFEIGKVKICSFGFMAALAIIVCYFLLVWQARKQGKRFLADAENIFFLSVIGGIIGARAGYVILNFRDFTSVLGMFEIWRGGLVSYTGILMALLFAFAYIRIKKIDFLEFADFLSPLIALGFAIGRIGCFLNWYDYGKSTMGKIAIMVNSVPKHPVQIYLAVLDLLLFILLFYVYNSSRKTIARTSEKKRGEALSKKTRYKSDGTVFLLFLWIYSLIRFFTDFIRAYPAREYIGGMAISQWISMAILAVAVITIGIRAKIKKQNYTA